jgi:hypothetical protein
MRHQGQRRQEVLAELPVGRPRLGWLGHLEAEAVDQDRPSRLELDVVRARVLEPHARVEGPRLELEGEQRGLLELGEAPFVRVRDDLHGPRSHDGDRIGQGRELERNLGVLDDQPIGDELRVQAR